MALDELYELILTLERRIADEGAALRQSEALTRYALVDPLLRALGWDTGDAKQVMPEYRLATGAAADYALFSEGSPPPAVIIEAKKLGEPLDDRVVLQGLNYCNVAVTPYFALTDGRTWKIYATFEQASLADRLIVEFAIGAMDTVEVCIKALALWRRSVVTGNVKTSSPILPWQQGEVARVDPVAPATPTPATLAPSTPTPAALALDALAPNPVIPAPQVAPPARQSTPTIPNVDTSDWIPISEYEPQSRERLSEIKFPDGSTKSIRYQKHIIIEATRWLVLSGLLQPNNPAHCPITNNTRHLISIDGIHPNGIRFEAPEWVDGVFVETKAGNKQNVRYTRRIITTVNQDPSAFMVKRAG